MTSEEKAAQKEAVKKLAATYDKLKEIRQRTDLTLKPNPYLKSTFTDFDGSEVPLIFRYYQTQGVCHLLSMDRFVLGDDCGLGKTLEVITALTYLWSKFPNEKVIVLTNKNAVLQWVDEFAKFTTGIQAMPYLGTQQKREKIRQWFVSQQDKPTVLVMNYRLAVQDFGAFQNWKRYTLVADEATAFKNPKTRVHQAISHMSRQAHRSWGMTATLIKNNLMEGYGIYQVLVPGLFQMSASGFMQGFCVTRLQPLPGGRRKIPVIVGYRQEDIKRFKNIIDPFYLGRAKHEVATELPVLQTRVIRVGMTPIQEAKYKEALDGILEVGSGDVKETTRLTAIIYCQEIANHPGLIDCEGTSEKVEMLQSLLTDGGEFEGEKVIIFSRFEKMISILEKEFTSWGLKTVRVTGKEDDTDRAMARKAFLDPNSDVSVIFITMAGGDAINLQAAKALIFYDTPWSAGDYLQILGRMIRIGSKHDRVYAIHLATNPPKDIGQSIDDRVLKVNKDKRKLIESVIGLRIKGEGTESLPSEIVVDHALDEIFAGLQEDARSTRK